MFQAEDYSDDEEDPTEAQEPLPPDIAEIGDVFPSGRPDSAKLQQIRSLLPPYARATDLCESYVSHGSLFFRPFKRDELLGPFLQSIYTLEGSTEDPNPHTLATFFFILALAALLDLRLPPYNAEAERFYGAGRAALGLRSVYDSPLVDTVRAIGFMATYHSLAGKKYSRDSSWCLMSIAAKLAQCVRRQHSFCVFKALICVGQSRSDCVSGLPSSSTSLVDARLDRDPARWHMDSKTVQSRRCVCPAVLFF